MQTAYQIGQANAEEALDQVGGRDYPTLKDALDAYGDNARETEGVTDENVVEMERGFVDVLRSRGIAYRPYCYPA